MATTLYSDINASFLRHPMTKDIVKRFDVEAIKASIRAILKTRKGEKLFKPKFGADLESLLFEIITPFTRILAKKLITEEIEKWEPRVLIRTVDVSTEPDYMGTVKIDVVFVLKEKTDVVETVTIKLERVR